MVLMSRSARLLEYFESIQTESVSLLRRLVELESNSFDKEGIDALAGFLCGHLLDCGADARIIEENCRGNHLHARWSHGGALKPVLLLGHLDTVWPRGTVNERPFSIREDRAFGPGVFDMKSGVLLFLLVFKALQERQFDPGRDVILLLTSDEEIGSECGLRHLRSIAGPCAAVLCAEPPLSGGKVKTARSGVGTFRLKVRGIAAHAGVDYSRGASAILELSRLIVELHAMTDLDRGIQVNAGVIRGGIASNVIAADAEADVDFRFKSTADGRLFEERIRSLKLSDARCKVSVEGGINHPPLERTDRVIRLYEKARALAADIGMELGEGSTGGASDGSHTAAMGIPTLDGLGVDGGGAHAIDEHVILSNIPRRAALLSNIIAIVDE